jgi:glycosyltransferase involved in cell wall biosynthesis
MARVAHLTSAHPPYDTRIFHRQGRALAEAGYEVVLIVPHERDEVGENLRIRAVAKPNGRLERITRTPWYVYQFALEEDAEIYHFHDPDLIWVGFLLKLLGKRVVYDVHEDFPRVVLRRSWIPSVLRGLVSQSVAMLETAAVLMFDGIVAATPPIASRFPCEKTTVVQNYPIIDEVTPPAPQPYAERDAVIVYVGGISSARGIFEAIDGMALLSDQLGARLVVAGRFDVAATRTRARRMPGWKRVEFLGWQSREGVRDLLARARVGLYVPRPVPNLVNCYPVKLFEYMCAGIPVVVSDFPIWQHIVGAEECGLLVDPLNPRAIADALTWLLEHPDEAEAMGKRGQEAVRKSYNWDTEAQKLLRLYERLTT